MANATPDSGGWSSYISHQNTLTLRDDQHLVLRGYQMSEGLLLAIERAQSYIGQTFRVQIEQNVPEYFRT